MQSAAASQPAVPIVTLNLKVRFSHSSIPDISLPLPIPSRHSGEAEQLTVNNLKGRVRGALPQEFQGHGLKLIYSGRVLQQGSYPVVEALRLDSAYLNHAFAQESADKNAIEVSSRPDELAEGDHSNLDLEGKGKARASYPDPHEGQKQPSTDYSQESLDAAEPVRSTTKSLPPIYLHCAITPTPLSPSALATQQSLEAETLRHELKLDKKTKSLLEQARLRSRPEAQEHGNDAQDVSGSGERTGLAAASATDAQPRGFDRLLAPSSGFDTRDVRNLRSQFQQIISARYTPDAMPSPTSLLTMEEAWLDESSYAVPEGSQSTAAGATTRTHIGTEETSNVLNTGGVAANTVAGGYTDDDAAASLDDTFFGVFVGFFWPLGACVWGLREEGVWSRRRGRAVMAGVLINVLFGVVKVLS